MPSRLKKMTSEMGSFKVYLLKRGVQAIPTIFGVLAIAFTLIHIAPGDPVYMLSGETEMTQEYYNMLRARFGLDRPLPEQFIAFVIHTLQGDLGYSYTHSLPVTNLILERLPATLLLMLTALTISSVLGTLLGVISARKPYSLSDNLITTVSLIWASLPVFWLGLLLLLFFSYTLGLFPVQGMTSARESLFGINYAMDVLHHLVLPSTTLGLSILALTTRLTRSSMLEELAKDYVVTARCKGLGEKDVLFKHALRNALIPTVTIIGVNLSWMIAGAILTETVFAWPGLGRLLYDALFLRDYPLILGVFVYLSVGVILINFGVDLLYGLLDPRIRHK